MATTTTSLDETATLPVEDLLTRFETSTSGLTEDEAAERLEKYGPNELAKRKKRVGVIDFLSHFKSPLVLILLVAGLMSGIFGDVPTATVIFIIIFFSVILDYYQESKAQKAAETLKEKVSTTATVIRDNQKQEIKLRDIVPGDVIFLSAGDVVPSDARVIDAKDLFIDQSSLTGESFPIEKNAATLPEIPEMTTENQNLVFMGTSVVSGTSNAVVVNTGSNTEFGKIARRLAARENETEFEVASRRLGILIVEVTLVLVIFIFFILALARKDILQSFLFAIAIAVGLTPELLPMIITINLSKGGLAMAKKGVIVKKLTAIQNFGNMDVLCTDKTGTLTENKISLEKYLDIQGEPNEKVLLYSFINSYFETGLKSPLDDAILKFKEIDMNDFQKVDEIPFDFTRKRVSIVVFHEGEQILINKGAPEEVIKVCSHGELGGEIVDLTRDLRRNIQRQFNDLSSEGLRVLGLSYKMCEEKNCDFTVEDEAGMIFLGFLVFLDPPKTSAKESLDLLKQAGIEVKIVTGDNELVARKVCEQLGFQVKGLLLGSQILYMHDDVLQRAIERVNIFARVTPGQKSRILNALKANGHVVGFLGDGINDATSIKNADVGISVDNAVDVAKESADIILLEKGLSVLYSGVIEGRKTFNNTLKYLLMGTSSNFGNMFSVAIAAIVLPFLPMLPIQILLNNLLYDLSETAIPTDNVDEIAVSKPRKLNVAYVRRFMTILGPISSIFDMVTFVFLIYVIIGINLNSFYTPNAPIDWTPTQLLQVAQFQTGWFIESMATQTLVIFILRTNVSPFYKSKPSPALIFSSFTVVAIAIIIPWTPLASKDLFGFASLPWQFFIFLIVAVIIYLSLVEIAKKKFHAHYGTLLEQAYVPVNLNGISTQAD